MIEKMGGFPSFRRSKVCAIFCSSSYFIVPCDYYWAGAHNNNSNLAGILDRSLSNNDDKMYKMVTLMVASSSVLLKANCCSYRVKSRVKN